MESIQQQSDGATLNGEARITIAQGIDYVGKRYGGKRPSVSAFYRWTLQGVRGIRLETECVGRTPYTSIAAIDRFIDAVSAARTQPTPPTAEVEKQSTRKPRPSKSSAADELHRRAFRGRASKSKTAKGGASDAAR
jgi:Protein of unknown function (DUF1580)